MSNSTPKYLFTNNRSVLVGSVIIVVLGLALLLIDNAESTRIERISQLKGRTIGWVKTIEENDNIRSNEEGNEVEIVSYTIEFVYKVDGIEHYGKDEIDGSENTRPYIQGIIDSNFEQEVAIRYDPDHPMISMIELPVSE